MSPRREFVPRRVRSSAGSKPWRDGDTGGGRQRRLQSMPPSPIRPRGEFVDTGSSADYSTVRFEGPAGRAGRAEPRWNGEGGRGAGNGVLIRKGRQRRARPSAGDASVDAEGALAAGAE